MLYPLLLLLTLPYSSDTDDTGVKIALVAICKPLSDALAQLRCLALCDRAVILRT